MANCCSNSFYSNSFTAPDCSIECLASATPGAIFVGASGEIYILTGDDPCNLSDWKLQSDCCLTFTNLSDSTMICCNEELVLHSSDDSILIEIDELTGIDFKSNISITFTDDYANDFDAANGTIINFSDANGIIVEIISDGNYRISGNTYSGGGVPGALVPTHTAITNFYFDTANNNLYVWKGSWVRVNYLPTPVAIFSYTKNALTASFNGNASTSTQQGTAITYQWAGSGPGTVAFATPTAATTTATFTQPGDYVITLTVTDANSNAKAYTETILIEPKARCAVKYEIPDSAFLDPNNPLDSEVTTWITANGPFNNHTYLYNIGAGSATSPDFVWIYTC